METDALGASSLPFPALLSPWRAPALSAPPPLRAVFSFVRASSSRHPCLRAPAWAGRGYTTARHSGRRGAGRLGNRQKDIPRASAFVCVE